MPGCHLTIAEELIWKMLAKSPGNIVHPERLLTVVASVGTLRTILTHLRRKTRRAITNVSGTGYVLEPRHS